MERQAVIGCSLLLGMFLCFPAPLPARAANLHKATSRHVVRRARKVRYHFISCVPYARERSGISLPGNAWQWWGNAAGRYARGHAPRLGAVLAFRSIPRMPLGHVAVVSQVINPREVLVDQANWIPAGAIRLGVPVVDVSPENDWTAVRVSAGDGHFGTVYPTYGFIYRSPPHEAGLVETARRLPLPPSPPGSRPPGMASGPIEVAEAPNVALGSPLVTGGLRLDAPDHTLR
ncbi:MAG: CHAP domain-containing protein [Gammaproteobacteria bacterium]